MIKAIIFDFDGVILESADIKTEAFKELFAAYPQKIVEIVYYHLVNAGISRDVKFRHIYERILKIELSREKEMELGERFSQITLEKVLHAPFVTGAKEFLDAYKDLYQLFIASGAPEEELQRIIQARALSGYFKEIHGSPRKKIDIINAIIKRYNFAKNEVVYVGDAESDRSSAQAAAITFIERRPRLARGSEGYTLIGDLSNLKEVLTRIEN